MDHIEDRGVAGGKGTNRAAQITEAMGPAPSVPATGSFELIVVEPLGRSTGHQSWFAGNLASSLARAGLRPTLLTFDGMHDDADLVLEKTGCDVRRVSSGFPPWLKRLFGKVSGVPHGGTASPSSVRWRWQIYFYNVAATAVTVLFATGKAQSGNGLRVIHLLCPPSGLVIACLALVLRAPARIVVTTFAPPEAFGWSVRKLRKMCRQSKLTLVVQTRALEAGWARAVGPGAVRIIPLPAEESPEATAQEKRSKYRESLDLPDDGPIVAVIGCIAPRKGYIELFQALRGLPQDFRVLLIGDTARWIAPDPEEVAREAGWAGKTIIRRTFVPENAMSGLFGAVNVVALLYRDSDGSSGILSLCQKYRVPVLATCFGEIGARVEAQNLGVTADPGNPEEVRQALRELLANHSEYVNCTRRSERDASLGASPPTLSWTQVAETHADLYTDLLPSRRSHTEKSANRESDSRR